MESLSFLLQQFFFSFFAGCTISVYAIIYYFMLRGGDILPICYISGKINLTFAFIAVAIAIGLIIEGICQVFTEMYYFRANPRKIFKDDVGKEHTRIGRLLYCLIAKPTICLACKDYPDKDKSLIKKYEADLEKTIPEYLRFYNALQVCTKIAEKSNINVYRFRDVSFILQMMRLSFFVIALISLLSVVCIFINHMTGNWGSFEWFIVSSLIISIICIVIIPSMSRALGKRYIREVEYAHYALESKKMPS